MHLTLDMLAVVLHVLARVQFSSIRVALMPPDRASML